MAPTRIIEILRALHGTGPMLWLTGGVAVDFLVGRWTRAHKDVDLVALSPERAPLQTDLLRRGFVCAQDGSWTTRWALGDAGALADLEIVFVEPAAPRTCVLVIPDRDTTGARAGRYPCLPDYLDPQRTAELDGVRFPVCSAEGEWLARMTAAALLPGRSLEPKIRHDLELLQTLVSEERRRALLTARASSEP